MPTGGEVHRPVPPILWVRAALEVPTGHHPNSSFHTVDHPENVAAVFYAHMWRTPAWQAAYRTALHQRLGFSTTSFAKGVVTGALALANMWINDTDLHLAAIQASIITSVLSQAPNS